MLKKSSGIDCPARTIHEEVLQAAVVTAVNDAWSRKDAIIPKLQENIRSVLEEDSDARLEEIDEAIRQRQTEFLDAGSRRRLMRLAKALSSLEKTGSRF